MFVAPTRFERMRGLLAYCWWWLPCRMVPVAWWMDRHERDNWQAHVYIWVRGRRYWAYERWAGRV